MSKHFAIDDGQGELPDTGGIAMYYESWLWFIKTAGSYAKRYYLLQDLEQTEHNPQSDIVLARYYDGDLRALKLVLQDDIERLERNIITIREHQLRLGLGGFKVDGERLSRFIDSFSLVGCLAPQRRKFYRRKIRDELDKPAPRPYSLNQLEAAFKNSKSYKSASSDSP